MNIEHLDYYLVGGAVRDTLMGKTPKDKDYVVINSSEEEMLSLGFEQVGKDFPVFLHPETKEEFALARKEKKSGVGYNGFTVETKNVSLEEDLFRRDLTINAMALDKNGKLIDPYHGYEDLQNKTLKHVSPYFQEDPLRILRIARFAARYNFSIHPDTMHFMKNMVQSGEVKHLTPERVWKEFEKTISEPYLNNFFTILHEVDALQYLGNFSTILQNMNFLYRQEIKILIEKQTMNDLLLIQIFQDFQKNDFQKISVPQKIIELVSIFQDYKHQEAFYQHLSTEEKLKFLKRTQSIHSSEKALLILQSVFLQKSFENYDSHFKSYYTDVQKIKNISYEEIQKNNKNKNIGKIIQEAQINALHSSHPSKSLKI
jgi:tRNA nucleotidyltransferase (CCA-adding enzyme)